MESIPCNNNGPETIIIERMYAGRYLKNNIGHEIINTFKTDKGENYIYISPNGLIKSKYENTKFVLLVRLIEQHCFEVLGYAGELSLLSKKSLDSKTQKSAGSIENDCQSTLITERNIAYGGVKINELFSEQNNTVFVTFQSKKYRKPKQKLYIVDDEKKEDSCHIYIKTKFAKQSLRMYFDVNSKKEPFDQLNALINNNELWEEADTSEKITYEETPNAHCILDIIKKTDDELVYSNWIAYYLDNDKNLMSRFVSDVLMITDNKDDFTVKREYNNIDIWLENTQYIIVIENKIKSGINGIDKERQNSNKDKVNSQLSKYYDFAQKKKNDKQQIKCFIFLPNYNMQDFQQYKNGEKYTSVNYSDLKDFFSKQQCSLPFYQVFICALEKHSVEYKNDLYNIMKERFIHEIKKRKN